MTRRSRFGVDFEGVFLGDLLRRYGNGMDQISSSNI